MKLSKYFLFVCCVGFLAACKKDHNDDDKRSKYVGQYQQATAQADYQYNFTGTTWERTAPDTAVFSISKHNNPDSSDYIIIHGAVASQELHGAGGVYYNSIRFVNNGEKVYARVTDSNFVIPRQNIYNGSSLNVQGDARIHDNRLTFTYSGNYRGLTKTSTITLRRQ